MFLTHALRAISRGVAVVTDPFFKYVSMLLPGTGTNGVQNNTFVDSSTNNFTITRNGNTTQGTFSPYGSNWSNYFDGSGDYLSVANNAAFNLGTTFTIEFWFYRTATQAMRIVSRQDSTAPYNGYNISYGEVANTWYFDASGTSISFADGGLINQWVHYAWVVNGTSGLVYRNGVAMTAAATQTAQTPSTNTTLLVGAREGPTNYLGGYISNLRIVKGTAVYTAAFTPSTTPLTAITNTSLLTCQSNRFIDNSTNNFAITKVGDTSIQRFSPFSPSASYSTSVIGGSGYFDGTGDYLSLIGSGLGGGNFTIELWGYFTSYPNAQNALYNHGAADGINSCILYLTSAGSLSLYNYTSLVGTSTTNVPLNTWTHMAVTRVGTTLTYYINGVASGTGTSAANISETTNKVMQGFGGIAASPIGYISNLRTVVGTAVYTANFTPPTAPLTAITNTSLLLNFTNGGIIDNAMINNLETVGNAQISTAQSKFGGGSMYFDGAGDYAFANNSVNFTFGTGNFTIELWINSSNITGTGIIACKHYGSIGTWIIYRNTTTIQFYCSSSGSAWNIASGITIGTISANTWYHVAITRSGNNFYTFLNGVAGATVTNSASLYAGGEPVTLGGNPFGADYYFGYIDDFRITTGYARYTANFTPPTAALPTS
jgi:hypothetical protein